jgi:hypothetical protein
VLLPLQGCCWVQQQEQQAWLPVLLLLPQLEQPLLLLLGQGPLLLGVPCLLLLLQQVRTHCWEGLLLGCCRWLRWLLLPFWRQLASRGLHR